MSDDKSSTILLVAVSDSGIGWLEPRDFSFEELPESSKHGEGLHVVFVDGTSRFMPSSEKSRKLFTIDAGDGSSVDGFLPSSDYR
ncbi:MAG: hypothetical protein H8E37_03510 [Planctomycetes bacterium]|nr:hypothetical protein [Planctomycetota bacterium]